MDAIKKYSFDDVKYTPNRNSVLTVGGIKFSQINREEKIAFLRANGIEVGREQKKANKLMGLFITGQKGANYLKHHEEKTNQKSKSSATKPKCLKKDGTTFRIINVITSSDGKHAFQCTKSQATRNDLDSSDGKYREHYMTLLDLYNSGLKFDGMMTVSNESIHDIDDEFGSINDPDCKLESFNLDIKGSHENIAREEVDKLSCEEFESCVKYILAHYRQAKNNNTKSGNHGNFVEFTKKGWVVYLHMKLEEVGDKGLSQCAYPELNDDMYVSSSSLLSPPSRSSTTSSNRSKSPVGGIRNKIEKNAEELSQAKLSAALNIVKEKEFIVKEKECVALQKLEQRFDELRSKKRDLEDSLVEQKDICDNLKDDVSKRDIWESNVHKYKRLKKDLKIINRRYDACKSEMNYKSDSSSDDNDSTTRL